MCVYLRMYKSTKIHLDVSCTRAAQSLWRVRTVTSEAVHKHSTKG